MRLTEEQVRFFEVFGYLAFPGLMADRVDEIIGQFESVWAERGGGHAGQPHEGKARSCIVPFIDQSESLCSLLDDPRIVTIADSLLGEDWNYTGSDGNYYVGDTGWHSDGWHVGIRFIKIAFYLDPLTRDIGCLRVMPGSHCPGDSYAEALRASAGHSLELWGVRGSEMPAAALETQPGDLVCFNHNTRHAAFGGNDHRRMFTINLCQQYPEERLEELRGYIAHHARFWVDRVYGEKMVRTAGPDRMRHLEQVMANDGHLAELSQKARLEMAEPSRG